MRRIINPDLMSSQVDEEDIMMTNANEELSRITNNNDEFSLNSMTIPQSKKTGLKKQDKKLFQTIKKPAKSVKEAKKTRIQEAKIAEPKKGLKIKSPKKRAETEVPFCNASYEVAVPNMFKSELNKLEKLGRERSAYNRMAKEADLSEEPCIVCNHVTGLKTKCAGGETAHIICGLMSDNFSIDFSTMVMTLVEPIKPVEGARCNICASETGQQLRCLKKSCKQSVHVFCLMEQRRHQLTKPTPDTADGSSSEEEEEITGWQIEIKILDYSKQKFVQQYDCIKPLLENLDFLKVAKPQDMELLTPENTPQKQNLPPRVLQNKLPARFNLPKRGGKVSIVCEEHRSEPTFCYCGSESQQLHMLMCDYCQKWFHTKCEGLKSTEAQLLQEYKCTLCAAWIEKVESVLMPAITGAHSDVLYQNQEDFKTWECWKRSILPLQKLPVKLSDCVLMAQVWQKQTEQLLKEVVSVQMIKQQILVAQHIPLYLDVGALNERIRKACEYQQSHPYSDVKIKSVVVGGLVSKENRKDNSKCADEVRKKIQQELEECKVVTQQAEELQFQVISQNETVEDAVGILFEGKQVSFERLEEIASDIDAEVQVELSEKIGTLFKETKKWVAFDSKSKTIAEVFKHITEKPVQVDLAPQCQRLQDEISAVQAWSDQYGQLNGIKRLNHIKTVSQLGLRSDLTKEIAAALKAIGTDTYKFCSNVERKTRCTAQLSDAIQKLTSQTSEVAKDFLTYLTDVKVKVESLQEQLIDVNEGKTPVNLESLLQLQSQANELPVLVPGEVLLNQAVEVLSFAAKKQNTLKYEFLTQFKCSLSGDTKMELDQITASVNDIQSRAMQAQQGLGQHQELSGQNLEQVVAGVKQLARLNSDLKKTGVVKTGYDFQKLEQFFAKLQTVVNGDFISLQQAKKEVICQLTTQLEPILKSVDFCPFLNVLKTQLDQLKKQKNVGACLSGKLSLKKLEDMLKSCGTDDKLRSQIDQQLALAKEWYLKYQPLSMTDAQLRKRLAGGDYESLITVVEQLEQEKNSIKLEITDSESKVLSKIKKWASTVRDCHRVMTEELEVDDLMAILQTLKELKSLPQEIPACKQAQERISMVQQFVLEVEQIIQEGKPDTIQLIKDRLLKAASEITVNIEALVKEYNSQIVASEKWLQESEKESCDADALLKLVKEDKEGDLNLVSEQAVQQLRVKSLRNLFKAGNMDVKQFIASIEKQRELLADEGLKNEKAIFDLAKKVKQMGDGKKKVDFTLAEADMMSISLPFTVPAQCAATLKQMKAELVSIQKQVEQLVAHGDASIQNLDQQLCALKALQIRSELEEELQQMNDDIKFAIQLSKMILDFNSKNTILYDDLKRVQKLQLDAKVKCPEAEQCVKFLTEEREKFDALQKKISQLNVEGAAYTYQQLFNAQVEITELKVDFQQKERVLRTDLWHLRLSKFVKELELDSITDLEVIQADLLRYWLEDAQELELTKDPKYDILNDLCDAVDHCYKAFRLVTTQGQFDELKAFISSEVCKRLHFTRAESEVKITGEEGEMNPKAYLSRLVSAKKDESDVQMTNLEAESSDDSDGEVTGEDEVAAKQPTKKREKKALEKKDSVVNKVQTGSSKKIEEMKKRVQKNKGESSKAKPEVKEKQPKAAKKVQAVVTAKEPVVSKGIAGGVKIGGGIKQKLGNFKKKSFTSPSSKVAEAKADAEPVVEKKNDDVPQDDQKMEEEPAVEKAPVKAAKKPVEKPAVKPKVESKLPKVEAAKKDVKVVQKKEAQKPEPKPEPKPKIVAKPGKIIGKPAKKVEESKEQPETEADSPKPAAKAVLAKPVIGVKRKPMGSLAASLGKPSGLAASLKKLN